MNRAALSTLALCLASLATPAQGGPTAVWQLGDATLSLNGAELLDDRAQTCVNVRLSAVLKQIKLEHLDPAGAPLDLKAPLAKTLLDGQSLRILPGSGSRIDYWLPLKPPADGLFIRRTGGTKLEPVRLSEGARMPDLMPCVKAAR